MLDFSKLVEAAERLGKKIHPMPEIPQEVIDLVEKELDDAGTFVDTLIQQGKDKDATIKALNAQIANPPTDTTNSDALTAAANKLAGLITPPAPADAPVATPLTLSTTGGTAIPLPFAATDGVAGFSGETFTFEVVTQPTLGTVAPDPLDASAFVYTPNAAGNGSDSFTYTATGQTSGVVSAPATVSISNG